MPLQAYDQHLNMILGDVEEIVTTVEIDDETYEEIVRVWYYSTWLFSILFLSSLRGEQMVQGGGQVNRFTTCPSLPHINLENH